MNKPIDYNMPLNLSARLGPLEVQLLRWLWQRGSGTVREVLEAGDVEGAYTTLMTTLDRLHKKGLLNREAEGRAFRYSPAQTEDEFNGEIVRNAIRHMLGAAEAGAAPLSFLVEAISEHDRNLLDQLEVEIERKRRELNGDVKA
jgi:BlaI family transcriptional regulator, penicillinase repressor